MQRAVFGSASRASPQRAAGTRPAGDRHGATAAMTAPGCAMAPAVGALGDRDNLCCVCSQPGTVAAHEQTPGP